MSDHSTKDISFDVAIVGIACRFPEAENFQSFWRNIFSARESIQNISTERLRAAGVADEDINNPAYVPAAAFLDGIEYFDPDFFNLSRKEASVMDPQQRHFLEVCYEALEIAGYAHLTDRNRVGLFAGCGFNSYLQNNILKRPDILEELGWFYIRHTSNDKDFLTTRVAYELNLTGPCVSVQTACSTSLVATHFACSSLLAGECDLALAGGVTIEIPYERGYLRNEGDIVSADGHCKPFSADSTGTVFGSGAGVVALKRLEDAILDGDYVYAVIKGTAINNDGQNKVGYFAPGVDGHAHVIHDALEVAGVPAASVELIEAHGTGTYLGDPVEVKALTSAYSSDIALEKSCALGSVKSQIGHLDTAAGVASLIKAVGAVHEHKIPPTLYADSPNPEINFKDTRFYLPTESKTWNSTIRRAGISSLGVGGTNAHVIIENYIPPQQSLTPVVPAYLVRVSANDPLGFQRLKNRYVDFLERSPDISDADFFYTLNKSRKVRATQKFYVVESTCEFREIMHSGDVPGASRQLAGKNVFMFAGGGAQRYDFGKDLLLYHPAYKTAFHDCARIIKSETGIDLLADKNDLALNDTDPILALPFLFSTQYAFAQFLESVGIHADCYVGHSMGEYTAACLAGVFSLEDALKIVIKRAQLFKLTESGTMLSATLQYSQALEYSSDRISIAAHNAPELVVFSGQVSDLTILADKLNASEIATDWIHIDVAAHSHLLEPILDEFQAYVDTTYRRAPIKPLFSNVSGSMLSADEAVSAQYWRKHLRETVRFHACVESLLSYGVTRFIEAGPGKVLATLSRMARTDDVQHFSSAFLAEQNQYKQILKMIGEVAASGIEPDWKALYATSNPNTCPVPTYPFARERCWIEPLESESKPSAFTGTKVWQPVFKSVLCPDLKEELRPGDTGSVLLIGQFPLEIKKAFARQCTVLDTTEHVSELPEKFKAIIHIPQVIGSLQKQSESLYEYLHTYFIDYQDSLAAADTIIYLSSGALSVGGETLNPAQRVITAFASVAGTELGVSTTSIDYQSDPETLVRVILQHQLDSRPYCLRHNTLFTPDFLEVELPHDTNELFSAIPNNSCCIITGAFGSLGREIATAIAERNVHLILIGRRVPASNSESVQYPIQYKQLIEQLDALDATYTCLNADFDNPDSIHNAFEPILDSIPDAVSIFHLAGLLNDSLIHDKNFQTAKKVLRSKISGLESLLSVLGRKTIQHCILFSSVSSFQGSAGQADYASANAVLESYATQLRQCGIPATAISWGPWAGSGMAERIVRGGESIDHSNTGLKPELFRDDSFTYRARFELDPEDWIVAEHILPDIGRILPATGMYELILEGAAQILGSVDFELRDVFFIKPVVITSKTILTIRFSFTTDGIYVTAFSNNSECTSAFITTDQLNTTDTPGKSALPELRISSDTLLLDQSGTIEFGSHWDCLKNVSISKTVATLKVEENYDSTQSRDFFVNPALLDVALFGVLQHCAGFDPCNGFIYVPVSWDSARIYKKLPSVFFVSSHSRSQDSQTILLDVTIQDSSGNLIGVFQGLQLQAVTSLQLQQAENQITSELNVARKENLAEILSKEAIPLSAGITLLSRVCASDFEQVIVSRTTPSYSTQYSIPAIAKKSGHTDITRLGHVEAQLSKLPEVLQSVVLNKVPDAGVGRVLAYILYTDDAMLTGTAIRNYLQHDNAVPESELPVLCLDIDTSAMQTALTGEYGHLPDPFAAEIDFVPAQNEYERYIVQAWTSLLGVDRISRYDSFLDIGGHSLLALRFLQKVKRERGVMLDPGSMVIQNVMQLAEQLQAMSQDCSTANQPEGLRSKIARGLRFPFRE